ncbi:MAG: response regulator [Gemmatimonadota bacterium]
MKVLIVDDEHDVLRALKMRFEANGYQVCFASDGVQATAIARRERPDLIVLDIGMPGGDGFVVAERLRATATTQMIPIIMLTARTGISDAQRAMELQVDRYLTKPFNPEELLRVAAQLTGQAA